MDDRVRRVPRRVAAASAAGVVVVLCAAVALALAGALLLRHQAVAGPPPPPDVRSQGRDALWLGHRWVDGRATAPDRSLLVERLRDSGVADVYVHVGPLADDGTLDPGLAPDLRGFLAWLHRELPAVRAQAWLGNVVGRDRLDPDDAATRGRVVEAARSMLAAGFAGIHYDLEPIRDGNPSFLALLDDTRRLTAARGAVLSVAAEAVEPARGMARLAGLFRPQWWTASYLHEVAGRVDQVALMTYDTGLPSAVLYAGLVARQIGLALAVVPPEVHLLAGAPAFHTDDLGHHAAAETVHAAALGLRMALTRAAAPDRPVGLALYVDFTATADDWRGYRDGWLRPR